MPSSGACVPRAQGGQNELLCAPVEVPRAHGVQLALRVSPSLGWLVPGGQPRHPALLFSPMLSDHRPASHGVKTMLVSAPSSSQ